MNKTVATLNSAIPTGDEDCGHDGTQVAYSAMISPTAYKHLGAPRDAGNCQMNTVAGIVFMALSFGLLACCLALIWFIIARGRR